MSQGIRISDDQTLRLPVLRFPKLSETCASFLDWAAPFLNGTELAEARRQVKAFLSPWGEGQALQRALNETLAEDPSFLGYLPYWGKWYLEQDEPLGLYTNPYYLLDMPPSKPLERAADLICSALEFCLALADGALVPDELNGRPLCMKQYSSIFGAVRLPEEGPDRFVRYTKPRGRRGLPRHIAVLAKGRIFSLEVLDGKSQPYGRRAIEESLRVLTSTAGAAQIHPGIFTTLRRSEWARIRKDILRAHKRNEQALEAIEGSLFVLCLDDYAPAGAVEAGRALLSGGNRWYDKTLQIIVFSNGQAGINFEHSHLDGLPMTRLARHLVENKPGQSEMSRGIPVFREISLNLTTGLRKLMEKTSTRLDREVGDLGTSLLRLPLGKGDIKNFGISPDAFVQLALLLAGRRHWDRWISISEAVMLRLFDSGRTGVMRTLTPEALSFVTLMNSSTATRKARAEALKKASKAHSERIKKCLEGRGPEEHLNALLAIHRHKAGKDSPRPVLFAGKAWNRLQDTLIASSTTRDEGLALAGWGPLSLEGLGARYMKTDPDILINLSYRESSSNDPEGFMETLLACVKEMMLLFEEVEVKKKDTPV